MFIHGHADGAEKLAGEIEERVERETGTRLDEPDEEITIRQRKVIGFGTIARPWAGSPAAAVAKLVGTGKVPDTVIAFSIGAGLMIAAGPVEVVFGVKAERQSLESIAQPLTAQEADTRRGGPAPATT